MNPPRHDLEGACYHEHAHAVVAWHYGIPARVEIGQRNVIDPLEEKLWTGRCHLFAEAGEHARAIALAGEIAVLNLREPDIPADEAWYHMTGHDGLFDPALSETDLARLGALSIEEVAASLELVRRLWPDIQLAAESEILYHLDVGELAEGLG